MASEAEALQRPLQPPCAFIFGGELLVTVGDATGNGGRNQEFALAAAARIAGSKNIVVASADSDGTDGPTNMAGGIADGETLARARAAGFDVAAELANHNSRVVLEALGDSIVTGVRGTNVRDLRVVYVGGAS
jgi:glycerate-2-kinase